MLIQTTAEIITARLKQELKSPNITDARCTYIIQKIKLLNMRRRHTFNGVN
jgi:hypothetical protein